VNDTDELRRGGYAILLFVLLSGLTGFAWTLRNGRGVEFGLVFGVVILYGAILSGRIALYDAVLTP
jgi:hypothetical protein